MEISENMTEIDLALDDIISKHRPRRTDGGGGGGKRRAPRVDEPLTPSFRSGNGGGGNRRFGGAARGGGWGSGGGGRMRSDSFGGTFGFSGPKRRMAQDDVVWINIANLPDTVLTADLQELFQGFNVQGLGVHYDEFGQHMGTADLFVNARSAKAILREYANIAIDGQKIRFAIVSEQAADTPQFQNHQRRAGGRPPIRPRRNRPFGGGRSDSGQSTRTYSRSRSPLNRGFGGGPVRRNNPPAPRKNSVPSGRQQVKSNDELDRELEAYMRGNKHPRIQLNE